MIPPAFTLQFIILSSVQLVTMGFSLIILVNGLKRYFSTERSEIILRKSVKYFCFILISIFCAALFSLIVNIYYLFTENGIIAGYLYDGVATSMFANVFCILCHCAMVQ